MALGIVKIYLGSPFSANRRCSRSVCSRSVGSRSVCRGQLSWTPLLQPFIHVSGVSSSVVERGVSDRKVVHSRFDFRTGNAIDCIVVSMGKELRTYFPLKQSYRLITVAQPHERLPYGTQIDRQILFILSQKCATSTINLHSTTDDKMFYDQESGRDFLFSGQLTPETFPVEAVRQKQVAWFFS